MSTITYIDGPLDRTNPPAADAVGTAVPPRSGNEARLPSRAESVFHRDYARRDDVVNFDAHAPHCTRCHIVLGAVVVLCVYALVWSFEFIQRAQAVVASGVTP